MKINLCFTDPACTSIGNGCFLAEESCKRQCTFVRERLIKCSKVCLKVIRLLDHISHSCKLLQSVFVRRYESSVVRRLLRFYILNLFFKTTSSIVTMFGLKCLKKKRSFDIYVHNIRHEKIFNQRKLHFHIHSRRRQTECMVMVFMKSST